jgi:hypothetical protein
LQAPGGELRWLSDGRVACFSNDGEVQGRWQYAPAFGIVIALLLPAVLMHLMMRIEATDPDARSELQTIVLAAYSGPYKKEAFHWTVVMYGCRRYFCFRSTWN